MEPDDRSPRELVRHPERASLHAVVRARAAVARLGLHTTGSPALERSRRCKVLDRHNLVLKANFELRPQSAVPAGVPDRRHVDARLAQQRVPRRLPRARERRVLGPGVHDLRASRCAGSRSSTRRTRRSCARTTMNARARLPAEFGKCAASPASRTRSASARGSICGRSCCHFSASILGMVSKPVTSRSIWRSALLISVAVGCGNAHAGIDTHAAARASRTSCSSTPTCSRRAATSRAVAVRGGDDRRVRHDADAAAIGPSTRVIDLARQERDRRAHRRALPSLRARRRPRERLGARSSAARPTVVKVVAEAAKTRPASEWLDRPRLGSESLAGQQFPTKASLDAAVSDRPVLLRRVDGHAIWVNSRALAAANITQATPDPAGGKIVRDAKGEPTGVLDRQRDRLSSTRRCRPRRADVRERRILAAAKIADRARLHRASTRWASRTRPPTSIASSPRENRLPLRVYAYLAGDPAHAERAAQAHAAARDRPLRDARREVLRRRCARLARRAALRRTTTTTRATAACGSPSPKRSRARSTPRSPAAGRPRSTRSATPASAPCSMRTSPRAKHPGDHRLRIEHTQVIAPKDVPRMVQAHAIASMQPTHATSDMPWAEARIGKRAHQGRVRVAHDARQQDPARVRLGFSRRGGRRRCSASTPRHASDRRATGRRLVS